MKIKMINAHCLIDSQTESQMCKFVWALYHRKISASGGILSVKRDKKTVLYENFTHTLVFFLPGQKV